MNDVYLPQRNDFIGKAMSMKQFMDSRALNAEDLKTARLKNQQGEQALAEDQAYRNTMAKYGDDPVKAIPELMRTAPNRAIALTKSLTEQQKADAELHAKNLEADAKELAIRGQILSGAKDQATWDLVRPQFLARKGVDPAKVPEIYNPEMLQAWTRQSMDAAARNTADKNAFDQALNTKKFEYEQKNDETNRNVTVRGQDLTAKSAEETRKLTAARDAQAAQHDKVTEQQGAARLGLETQRFNATLGAGLDANGQPLPPDALKAKAAQNPAAQAIAEYRMKPPTTRSGVVPPIMREVMALNPNYDATQFDARNKYRIALTSGPQSQALNSLNTAIEHLDQFSEMAKGLGNGAFQPGNKLSNWLKATFGDSAPTNFDGMKTIMAGELASAFKKSGATDQEIHAVVSAIDRANSTNQLVDYATKVAIPALGGKIRTYEDQTRAQMGEKDPLVNQVVTPNARAVIQKHAAPAKAGPKKGETRQYQGHTYTFDGSQWVR